jgi:hypothetical protein
MLSLWAGNTFFTIYFFSFPKLNFNQKEFYSSLIILFFNIIKFQTWDPGLTFWVEQSVTIMT